MLEKLRVKSSNQPVRSWLPSLLTYSGWVIASFVLSALILVVLGMVLTKLGLITVPDEQSRQANLFALSIGVIMYLVMIVILVGVPKLIYKSKAKISASILGINRIIVWKDILISFAAIALYLVLLVLVVSIGSVLLPWIDLNQAQDLGLSSFSTRSELLLAFCLLVVIGPVVEELIFRGYLYGNLRKNRVPLWVSVLVASLIFGAVHMQWNVALDTFALSVVMCMTREVTGTIWPSIIMHMMKNGVAFYFLFVQPLV